MAEPIGKSLSIDGAGSMFFFASSVSETGVHTGVILGSIIFLCLPSGEGLASGGSSEVVHVTGLWISVVTVLARAKCGTPTTNAAVFARPVNFAQFLDPSNLDLSMV